jgi:hypothetical protein
MAYDETTAQRVRHSLGATKDISEKTLMGGRCFMVGSAMCCSVSGHGGLLVRVNPSDYEAALTKPHVEPMKMGKRTMRGFVRVAPEGYRTEAQLAKWLGLGVAAANVQPPKPAPRKKGASKPSSARRPSRA